MLSCHKWESLPRSHQHYEQHLRNMLLKVLALSISHIGNKRIRELRMKPFRYSPMLLFA